MKIIIRLAALLQIFGVLYTEKCLAQLTSTEKDLKKEMRLCRNEIYARHGRVFHSQDLDEYFTAQAWYNPSANYNDSVLSDREKLAAKTILELENGCATFSEREKTEVKAILAVIKEYFNKEIDTTFLTLGNFDGLPPIDTIETRIREKEGKILIDYSFIRNAQTIWNKHFHDPYLWIGNSKTLEDLYDNLFIKAHIAINKCRAERWTKSEYYENMKSTWALKIGIAELKKKGFEVSAADYQTFLDSFDEDLLLHSQDESGGSLQVWYEPVKEFVTFYAP